MAILGDPNPDLVLTKMFSPLKLNFGKFLFEKMEPLTTFAQLDPKQRPGI